jgi:hypothetical protein
MHNVAAEESLLRAGNFPDAFPRQPTKSALKDRPARLNQHKSVVLAMMTLSF